MAARSLAASARSLAAPVPWLGLGVVVVLLGLGLSTAAASVLVELEPVLCLELRAASVLLGVLLWSWATRESWETRTLLEVRISPQLRPWGT